MSFRYTKTGLQKHPAFATSLLRRVINASHLQEVLIERRFISDLSGENCHEEKRCEEVGKKSKSLKAA
jgi:hypothetical protein